MTLIDNPDSLYPACNVINHGISDLPYLNQTTTPYFPNYYLGAESGTVCDSLSGISMVQHFQNLKLQIKPNPGRDKINVSYSLGQKKEGWLSITNVLGENVFYDVLPAWSMLKTIDVSFLTGGIYVVRIGNGNIAECMRFVKQ
jgi:hypothetical protein